MPPSAGGRLHMASQVPTKALACDVVVPQDPRPEDVVDTTLFVNSMEEIYCVQGFGGRNLHVIHKREVAIPNFLYAPYLITGKEGVTIVHLSHHVTVRCHAFTCPCSGHSGKVLHISR